MSNAKMELLQSDDISGFNYEELEENLYKELDTHKGDFVNLKENIEKVGSPDSLISTISESIWEQFINQIAAVAGEDFIKENRGLKLDLSKDAHIQNVENFNNKKFATHNTSCNYEEIHKKWEKNFKKDINGNIVNHETRSGNTEATLSKGVRKIFDKGRPQGNRVKGTDMDHVVSAGEIIRNPELNLYMTQEELLKFANSEVNLNEIDAKMNRSKGDKSTKEWLDNENKNGQKPKEIFNITESDEKKLRKKDEKARKELDKRKEEAKKKSINAGKKSQKEEAFRISGNVLRAVVLQLLSELVKEIFQKFLSWIQTTSKNVKSLIEYLKLAISSFVEKLKTHMLNSGKTATSTIAQAILGPLASTLTKLLTVLKQGYASISNSIKYLNSPESKKLPFEIRILEVGKIVTLGLSATSAVLLGEVIEKGLITIPIFAFEIPFLGSIASLLGLLLSAIVSGVVGAIVINLIDRLISKKQKDELVNQQIIKNNEILKTQKLIIKSEKIRRDNAISNSYNNISQRHVNTIESINDILNDLNDTSFIEDTQLSDNEDQLNNINEILKSLS